LAYFIAEDDVSERTDYKIEVKITAFWR